MSIATELTLLANSKQAIKNSINQKGGSITDSTPFADYSTAIDNLPSGGSGNPLLTSIDVSDFTGTTFNRATSYITDVTIPSGVTSIGNYAFQNFSSLTSINIPSSVTSIGQNAFSSCTGFTSFNIPSGVTSIGNYAFSSCTGLTGNMDIKGTSYGERAFMNCTGLTSLTVTDSNAIFAYAVFDGCTSVTSVNVDSLETWLSLTFTNVQNLPYGNPLSLQQKPALNVNGTVLSGELSIPNTVTSIKNGAFYGYDRITSLVMSNTVTSIYPYAFMKCTGLTNVTVGSGVTSIGTYAFNSCTSLASVDIPDSVATIENYAFSDTNSPVKVTIGSGITRINTGAFQNVTANGSVTIKKTTPPTLSGSYVFWGSYPIYVPAESVETYKAASGWSSYASRIYPITQVATVDGNPVYNYDLGNKDATTILSTEMDKLPTGTSIEFAEGITNMSGSISGYTTVTLPSTFTTFNDQDMIGSSVTTLTMKSTTPPTAERNKFGGSGLTAIYVPASAVDTYKAASGWSNFASIIEAIPVPTAMKWTSADGTQEISIACEDLIEAGTFTEEDRDNADLDVQIADVEGSAEIGDCVTIIGSQAFSDCSSLSSVTIPDSVTTITLSAFSDCSSLTSVTIPDSVTTIGDFVFQGCSSLTNVNIPDSVTTIGNNTFKNCYSLVSVTVNATTPPTLGSGAFKNTNNCPIYVPAESVEAYKAASGWSTYADRIQAIPNE